MGREIRRIPLHYEHPKDERGHYIPLHDQTWEAAIDKWLREYQDWKDDVNGERSRVTTKYGVMTFAQWHGDAPRYEVYRTEFSPDAVLGYCMYENVSEGTPDSPVFATEEELVQWLIGQGYSELSAREFVKTGWAPTMTFNSRTGEIKMNLDALDDLNK